MAKEEMTMAKKKVTEENEVGGTEGVQRCVIKPCPFCGSEPTVESLTISTKIFICCHNCKISQYIYREEDEAIEAWNERAL
jgi:Lar family restriction alleviation protein